MAEEKFMKIINVMVMSIDGKTTKGHKADISEWTSQEDKKYFQEVMASAPCLIMGRNTYEAAKERMRLSPSTLRIVMTHDATGFADQTVPGQLEFYSTEPTQLIADLGKRGLKDAILLGGETLNAEFLKNNLIDELWLTLEPVMLGVGNGLSGDNELDQKLHLLSSQQLNDRGTLLLKYRIEK